MRCKNCKHQYKDYSENQWLCNLFGYGDHLDNKGRRIITENSKGEEGCRYTKKQLDKFDKQVREEIEKGYGY